MEDNLAAQQLLVAENEAETAALQAARKTLEIANNRYRAGLVTYLEVATAQNAALDLRAHGGAVCGAINWSPPWRSSSPSAAAGEGGGKAALKGVVVKRLGLRQPLRRFELVGAINGFGIPKNPVPRISSRPCLSSSQA